MRIFVTGALGFVGQRLLPKLESHGHWVSGCDRDTVDVTDASAVMQAIKAAQPDAVVHLAAISFVPEARQNPALTREINVGGTRNVIRALQESAPKARLLLVGSSEQYAPVSPSSGLLDETTPLLGVGPYAESKTEAEKMALEASAEGLDLVRVRAFNHTGPGQEPRFVVPDFSRQVALIEQGAEAVLRVGNLESVRDFLHVDDVVEAYVRLLQPDVEAGAYNVSSGRATQIGEVLESLLHQTETKILIERDPSRWREADARVGDSSRLRKKTGWRPTYSTNQIIEELLHYWRKRVRQNREKPER